MAEARPTYIFVLNFNGRSHLAKSLPAVLSAKQPGHRVVVVDNASSDGSREFVRREFPSVEIFELSRNEVLGAINAAVAHYRPALFVFLVNDLVVTQDAIARLVKPLTPASDVFAVSGHMQDPNDPERSSMGEVGYGTSSYVGTRFCLRTQRYRLRAYELRFDGLLPTFVAGGFSAFDGAKFLALGGFDPIYHPYYWEDVDLSTRAWRRGYRILYDPRCIMFHDSRTGTIRQRPRIALFNYERNSHVHEWINVHDSVEILLYVLAMPFRLLASVLTGQWARSAGLIAALGRMPGALRRRRRETKHTIRSDAQLKAAIRGSLPSSSSWEDPEIGCRLS